jgi:hypothetical protein
MITSSSRTKPLKKLTEYTSVVIAINKSSEGQKLLPFGFGRLNIFCKIVTFVTNFSGQLSTRSDHNQCSSSVSQRPHEECG